MQALLVTADPAVEKPVCELLEARGHRVDVHRGGEAITGEPYRLAIIDLAATDAFDHLRSLRERPGNERSWLLAVADEETPEALRGALEAGADDYLTRPVGEDALKLRLAIGQRNLAQRQNDIAGQARDIEEALRHREAYYRALWENASDLVSILDLDGRVLYQSPASERLLGQAPEEIVGQPFVEGLHEADREAFAQVFEGAIEGDEAPIARFRCRHAGGGFRHLEALIANLLDDPVIGGLIVTSRDVTDRLRVEALLKRERAFFQQLFRNSPAGVVILDNDDCVVDANRSFVELFNYRRSEIEGQPLSDFIVPERLRAEAGQLSRAVFNRRTVEVETVRKRRDGGEIDVAIIGYPIALADRRIGAYGIYTDITGRKQAERKLVHDALHDSLTGLPNRTLLSERLTRALRRARRSAEYRCAVLFIDLDGFKAINDRFGHAAGDALLAEVARRLENCVRPGDSVARFGGDEFTVLLDDLQQLDDAQQIAHRILAAIKEPFHADGQEVAISASIGIATSQPGYANPDQILRDADSAMYRAKEAGSSRWEIFDSSEENDQAAEELRRTLSDDQLRLYYQPIVSLTRGELVGFEALVRWEHPQRGMVAADELVPLCEQAGLMLSVGRWVCREACRRLAAWQERFGERDGLQLSINLSSPELLRSELGDELARMVSETGADANSLGFEIAQEDLPDATDSEAAEALWALRKRGFRIYADRFGLAGTPLHTLHRLPLDRLKLDRALVAGMKPGGDCIEVVRAAQALGDSLGLPVIATGVESAEQLAMLRELGYGYAQGFHLAEPMTADEATALVEEDRRW